MGISGTFVVRIQCESQSPTPALTDSTTDPINDLTKNPTMAPINLLPQFPSSSAPTMSSTYFPSNILTKTSVEGYNTLNTMNENDKNRTKIENKTDDQTLIIIIIFGGLLLLLST